MVSVDAFMMVNALALLLMIDHGGHFARNTLDY